MTNQNSTQEKCRCPFCVLSEKDKAQVLYDDGEIFVLPTINGDAMMVLPYAHIGCDLDLPPTIAANLAAMCSIVRQALRDLVPEYTPCLSVTGYSVPLHCHYKIIMATSREQFANTQMLREDRKNPDAEIFHFSDELLKQLREKLSTLNTQQNPVEYLETRRRKLSSGSFLPPRSPFTHIYLSA